MMPVHRKAPISKLLARYTSSLMRRSPVARRAVLALPQIAPQARRDKQPNLVLIGAQKSGTTSLHRYLSAHPSIFMSLFKEPAYFMDPTDTPVENTTRNRIRLNLNDRDMLRYMQIGYRGEPWFGESSTYYSMAPRLGAEVPANIAARSPDARLIYIVRDPYQRIVSQYLWGRQNNFAQGTFEEVVRKRFDLMTSISCYAMQANAYLKHFRRDQLLCLAFDDLKKTPEACVAQVLGFLDLPPMPAGAIEYENHNRSQGRRDFSDKDLLLPDALVDQIEAVLEPDIAAFGDLSGLDVSTWSANRLRRR